MNGPLVTYFRIYDFITTDFQNQAWRIRLQPLSYKTIQLSPAGRYSDFKINCLGRKL